jgi:hypothetical protein
VRGPEHCDMILESSDVWHISHISAFVFCITRTHATEVFNRKAIPRLSSLLSILLVNRDGLVLRRENANKNSYFLGVSKSA